MVLAKTPRWFYLLVAFLGLLVLALGVWWLYLLTMFARMMGPSQLGVLNMVKWEGTTFLLLLISAATGLAILYWRDLKKTRALQALFASLTHELKTPLASMRLQAEVIRDLIADESHDHAQLTSLTTRLIQDTSKFEHELDKGLQLSRVEKDGALSLSPIDLERFVKKIAQKNNVNIQVNGSAVVLGDEMALTMVFRNLFENTARHNPQSSGVVVDLKNSGSEVICSYSDQGKPFLGSRKKLGELFYKHDSKKGTGIGLYLVKQLLKAQNGKLEFSQQGPLIFHLHLQRGEE
jgi:signal transduction histidine kinase